MTIIRLCNSQINNNHNFNIEEQFFVFDSLLYTISQIQPTRLHKRKEGVKACTLLEKNISSYS